MTCLTLGSDHHSFEVWPLSLCYSSSLFSCHPSSLFPVLPDRPCRSSICPLSSHWFSVKQLTQELCPSPSPLGNCQPGHGVRVQSRKLLTHTTRLSQCCRYSFHTHTRAYSEFMERVSSIETLNRCTPSPPFALQVISSKCAHTGMSQRGPVVWMLCCVLTRRTHQISTRTLTHFYFDMHT